jgi:hypothetical protein
VRSLGGRCPQREQLRGGACHPCACTRLENIAQGGGCSCSASQDEQGRNQAGKPLLACRE